MTGGGYEVAREIIDILTRPMDDIQKTDIAYEIASSLDNEHREFFLYKIGQTKRKRKKGSAAEHPKEKAKLSIDPSMVPLDDRRALIYGLYTTLTTRDIGYVEVQLGMDREEMKKLINKCVEHGYLERIGEKGVGKKYTIAITESGKKILESAKDKRVIEQTNEFKKAIETYFGKKPTMYDEQSGSPASPAATAKNSPKMPASPNTKTAGPNLKKAPLEEEADFIYSKLPDSIRIINSEKRYIDVIHISKDTGKIAYDINFCLAQAIIREGLGKTLTKKELDNMVSSATWGDTLKKRAEEFISPERGLVLIEGDEVHLSDACRDMIVQDENILFSNRTYTDFLINNNKVQKYRNVKFPTIGEYEIPPAARLEHCISSLNKRGVAAEKNSNGANADRNTPSKPVITIDTTNGMAIECKNNNISRKKVLVVRNKITDAGTKIRDMIESISEGRPKKDSLRYLEKYNLIDCASGSPALNDNGKTVYKAFSLL